MHILDKAYLVLTFGAIVAFVSSIVTYCTSGGILTFIISIILSSVFTIGVIDSWRESYKTRKVDK